MTLGSPAPEGFLFLCPPVDFQAGSSSLHQPDCVAYWFFDPMDVKRLSVKDVTRLGFPPVDVYTVMYGFYFHASAYAGLRRFHQAKGFDPDGLELARHLECPIYQISRKIDAPFAHVGGEELYAEDEENGRDSVKMNNDSERFPVNPEDEWEDAQTVACENINDLEDVHDSNLKAQNEELESPPLLDKMPAMSFKLLIAVQLALTSCLAFCWLYEPWYGRAMYEKSSFRHDKTRSILVGCI
ncbi:hypothetical protein MVEN_02218900 [Mycena venus]|uniref:Uncharacterized protein n=1 Tax=Mycena venus TaxID=2733690 RepID=A0A8H6X6W1_9AGAR|nr:hypothetical protein MVEN_02218900 [Mycena venus]